MANKWSLMTCKYVSWCLISRASTYLTRAYKGIVGGGGGGGGVFVCVGVRGSCPAYAWWPAGRVCMYVAWQIQSCQLVTLTVYYTVSLSQVLSSEKLETALYSVNGYPLAPGSYPAKCLSVFWNPWFIKKLPDFGKMTSLLLVGVFYEYLFDVKFLKGYI